MRWGCMISLFHRVYTQMKGTSLRLYITDVKADDTGTYNCTGRVDNIPSHWAFELQAYGE